MVHRRLLALAGQLRGPLAAGVLIGWLVMAARVTQAGLVGVVLGQIFAGRPFSDVTGLLWVIAALVVVRGTLVWAREVVAQAAAGRIKKRVRDRLYGKLLRLGPGYLTTTRSGEVQTTVVDGVEALEAYFSRYLPQLIVCLKSLNAVEGRRAVLREHGESLFGKTMRQMAVSMIDTGLTTFGVQLGVAMAVGVGVGARGRWRSGCHHPADPAGAHRGVLPSLR